MGSFTGLMEDIIKGIGKMGNNMVEEYIKGLIIRKGTVYGNRGRGLNGQIIIKIEL